MRAGCWNMAWVLPLLLGLAGGLPGAEPSPRERFAAGLAAYRSGDWSTSAGHFAAVAALHRSPAAQMALGNALYQQGRTGQAVLAWLRGLHLDPFSEDLAHNLELVTGYPPLGTGPLGFATKVYLAPAPASLELAGLLGLLGALAGFAAVRLGRRRGAGILVLAGFSIAIGALAWRQLREAGWMTGGRAVMVSQSPVVATAGPGAVPDFPRVFELRPGTPVRIHRSSGAFRQISLPTGAAGWVPRDALEEI